MINMNGSWGVANDNGFTGRDVYPTSMGATSAQQVSGSNPGLPNRGGGPTGNAVETAAQIGGQGNPIVGGLVFLALVVGLMFFAKWAGNTDDFKSIKPSVYNVFTIALAATAGMPVLKYAATKFPIPGVSTWVLAA
jgi:hypothetical protein